MECRVSLCSHIARTVEFIKIKRSILRKPSVTLNGSQLSVAVLSGLVCAKRPSASIQICKHAQERMKANSQYLAKKVANGCVIYGVNTGYGGSADVRSNDILELQRALIRHLNAGFGETLPSNVVKAVMAVRVNSLSLGYSGVRPLTAQLLADMFNADIIPLVPKRGSVSASGDLMPTSYIASCMMARSDSLVLKNGITMNAPDALAEANLKPITFQAKEALAVINSASFASALASIVLYDVNICVVLTQVATALTAEALCGNVESFHPTIHKCMPHRGQQEVATNIRNLLTESQFAIQIGERARDGAGVLKQDRYALRSSPQWLGPAVESVLESIRRVTIEINSANDNPIIDHEHDEVLHGANFQGTSITVAMDQCRQAIQLCGKLLLGQMQEIINSDMNNGLPPNLAGSDVNTDFGFKGMDTAMASYMSELDYISNNLTNHVLSTELHNQSVNSMALVSARYTQRALEILQMMIVNIFCAQMQAIDLRLLQHKAECLLDEVLMTADLHVCEPIKRAFPWYQFVFLPRIAASQMLRHAESIGVNEEVLVSEIERRTGDLMTAFHRGEHISEVESMLGVGTRKIYTFIRRDLEVPFYYSQTTPDVLLQKIYSAVKTDELSDILCDLFDKENDFEIQQIIN